MNELIITQPDDWHCHLRDDIYLARTVADTAQQFQRAIVMPNLKPPITTVLEATQYQQRIQHHIPSHLHFEPLMTLYLTEQLLPDEITKAKQSNVVFACKYYPAGATTNSAAGIQSLKNIYPLLEQMQLMDLPLCIHGESIAPHADVFDREKLFLEETLKKIVTDFPTLRIILEHISTKAAVEFVMQAPKQVAATITPHHLHYNRNDIFQHGIRPHYYCLPILKRKEDQAALIEAAISGNPKFFLGTDSAPHAQNAKENACGCAGIYSAHAAVGLYAEIFEKHHALPRFEKFASVFGAQFYQLPINQNKITLIKKPYTVPQTVSFGTTQLIPMKSGETVAWQIQTS